MLALNTPKPTKSDHGVRWVDSYIGAAVVVELDDEVETRLDKSNDIDWLKKEKAEDLSGIGKIAQRYCSMPEESTGIVALI